MSKYDQGNITPADVLDYTAAVEAMYGVTITIELKIAAKGNWGAWAVNARAWVPGRTEEKQSLTEKMVTYPSVHYRTFMGAVLGATMSLEQQLQGWYWLQQLQGPAAD